MRFPFVQVLQRTILVLVGPCNVLGAPGCPAATRGAGLLLTELRFLTWFFNSLQTPKVHVPLCGHGHPRGGPEVLGMALPVLCWGGGGGRGCRGESISPGSRSGGGMAPWAGKMGLWPVASPWGLVATCCAGELLPSLQKGGCSPAVPPSSQHWCPGWAPHLFGG